MKWRVARRSGQPFMSSPWAPDSTSSMGASDVRARREIVQSDQIVRVMKVRFEKELGPEPLENFPSIRASELVEDSMDVVTFVLDLESELGIEIPLDQVGPKLATMTFQELADELSPMMSVNR